MCLNLKTTLLGERVDGSVDIRCGVAILREFVEHLTPSDQLKLERIGSDGFFDIVLAWTYMIRYNIYLI
jgi:hypothetical protein